MKPEDIDFPVSYDWARFYNKEHKMGMDLPPIDYRLPSQREEDARLEAAISRAELEPDPRAGAADLDFLNSRIEYLEDRLRDLNDRQRARRKEVEISKQNIRAQSGGINID